MDPLLSIRRLGVITALTVFATIPIHPQDVHPDRFGLGVSGIEGWFGGTNNTFLGAEGFGRIARGSFWSARVDGAYFSVMPHSPILCISPLEGGGSCDTRYLGHLGTLAVTLVLGPTASNGLRPYYALLGVGGAATRWGGGYDSSGPASGAGPSLALIEAGVGPEFRALGGNRIELRIHRVSPSQRSGSHGELGSDGASLTIGVVW